jgi:hypothetical protein
VVIDAREEIRALTGFSDRGAGTDAERRAAEHLRARLERMGRDAATEAAWIRPRWALAHTGYAVMGIVASAVATVAPVAGIVLAAVALVLLAGDLGGRVHTGRLLTGRRASQNVLSPESGGRAGTLVLVAHLDAGQSGFVHGLGRWTSRLTRRVGPFGLIAWALLVILGCAIARAAGPDTTAISVIQFVGTVALIVALPLLADIALSDHVPAANDNASGVATVLRLAERYGGDLEHFDVWVLFTGGEEAFAEGMRAWLRRHRRELDPTTTIFLNVDAVGAGTVRYTRREGPLVSASLHPRLVELCRQIEAEDAEEGRYHAKAIVSRSASDALAARRAGFPSITLSCRDEDDRVPESHGPADTPDRVDDGALDRAFGFASELVELIDERIGPDVTEQADRAAQKRFSSA